MPSNYNPNTNRYAVTATGIRDALMDLKKRCAEKLQDMIDLIRK